MKPVFQSFSEDNLDCGLACLSMLCGKSIEHWRQRLKVRITRKTKKQELLGALREQGFQVRRSGRFSQNFSVVNLSGDALIKGYIYDGDEENGHWMVWDHKRQVLRDPNGYRAPFRATSYTELKRE